MADSPIFRCDHVPQPGDSPESRLLPYLDLPTRTFRRLPLRRTLALLPVSPVEVHGPHLPLGTDPYIGREIGRRAMLRFLADHPDRLVVELPPLCLGSDALSHPGSIEIPPRVVRAVVEAHGEALARAGLAGLILANFHGGPRHVIALERAARALRRRHPDFLALSPMAEVFSKVFAFDASMKRRLSDRTGVSEADLDHLHGDIHAGRLEGSAAMAVRPGGVHPDAAGLPAEWPNAPAWWARTLQVLESLVPRAGRARLRPLWRDLGVLLDILGWMRRQDRSYMGDPARADARMGEAVLDLMAEEMAKVVADVVDGRRRADSIDPLYWSLRGLFDLPGSFAWQADAPY